MDGKPGECDFRQTVLSQIIADQGTDAGDGVTVNIEAKTNYDANPNTGYLPGASLNKSTMDTWATVNMTQTSFREVCIPIISRL